MLAKLESYNEDSSFEISMQSESSTRLAAASSSSFHVLTPVSFFCKWEGADLLLGYMAYATADLLRIVLVEAMKSLTVISAKLGNILKKTNHKLGSMEYLNYICGSVGRLTLYPTQ